MRIFKRLETSIIISSYKFCYVDLIRNTAPALVGIAADCSAPIYEIASGANKQLLHQFEFQSTPFAALAFSNACPGGLDRFSSIVAPVFTSLRPGYGQIQKVQRTIGI